MKKSVAYVMALAFFVVGFYSNGDVSPGLAWAQASQGENVMAYVKNVRGAWYTGKIDHIDDWVVTIGDVNHSFARDVLFVSKDGFKTSRRHFHKGEKVKMHLDSKFKCAILCKI